MVNFYAPNIFKIFLAMGVVLEIFVILIWIS